MIHGTTAQSFFSNSFLTLTQLHLSWMPLRQGGPPSGLCISSSRLWCSCCSPVAPHPNAILPVQEARRAEQPCFVLLQGRTEKQGITCGLEGTNRLYLFSGILNLFHVHSSGSFPTNAAGELSLAWQWLVHIWKRIVYCFFFSFEIHSKEISPPLFFHVIAFTSRWS